MTRQEQEEAEQASYEEHMQALYDEQNWMQQMTEQVEQLQSEVARLRAEVERERAAVVAWLRDVARRDWSATTAYSMTRAVEAIERGEHRREEEK